MKSKLFSSLTIILCSTLMSISLLKAEQAGKPVGSIIAIEGKGQAIGAGGEVRNMNLGMPIYLKDRIVTEVGAKVQIMFEDDSVISQGEKSELTIDKYAYDPDDRGKDDCYMSFIKGVFRVVTGKITDLNPERFKVNTRMATIGIRGCEVGCRISELAETIYILAVTKGRSIIIQELSGVSVVGRQRSYVVDIANIVFFLQAGKEMERRSITMDEAKRIIIDSTPGSGVNQPGTGKLPGNADGANPSGKDTGSGDNENKSLKPFAGRQDDESGSISNPEGSTGDIYKPPLYTGGLRPPLPPPPLPPSETTLPNLLPPRSVFTRKGGGKNSDWVWGVWATDGHLDRVAVYSHSVLLPSEYADIVSSGIPYNLSGTGDSAAVIKRDGPDRLMTGTCDMHIEINVSVQPQWFGSFSMGDTAGDSLNFTANGYMSPDGHLTGNQTSYDLHSGGQTYSSSTLAPGLVVPQVQGDLIGSAGGYAPITGVMGQFNFDHINGPLIQGIFGTDLQSL